LLRGAGLFLAMFAIRDSDVRQHGQTSTMVPILKACRWVTITNWTPVSFDSLSINSRESIQKQIKNLQTYKPQLIGTEFQIECLQELLSETE